MEAAFTGPPQIAASPVPKKTDKPPTPPMSSRWRCYELQATPTSTPHGFIPKKLVVFERIDADVAEKDREFRVWSERFRDNERWTFSEGFVEGRVLRLDGRGYEVEKPRVSRVGALWGHAFALRLVSDIDVEELLKREAAMYRMERVSLDY